MPLYLSVGAVQPFADVTTEAPDDEPGVVVVRGDGKIVGIRLAETSDVVRLPGLIEKFGLNPERVWSRLHGDDDLTLLRSSAHRR
jgi:hypothetical protein